MKELSEIVELVQFLNPSARIDLKSVALTHVLDLSGDADGFKLLLRSKELLQAVIHLVNDPSNVIAKDAVLALVNVSANEGGAEVILQTDKSIVYKAISEIFDENSMISDPLTMLLSNISRHQDLVDEVIDLLLEKKDTIDKLVTCFTRQFNKKGMQLNYIGPIFSNFTQSPKGRDLVCNPEKDFLLRILPFTDHKDSLVRRGGAIGLLKNVCFDSARHDWLLSEEVNILPFILLLLAGPEEFNDEENDKLPIELQYLDSDKKREEDPDLRCMLLECLSQLCATRKSRDFLRGKGVYEILREYHKWENDCGKSKKALFICENVVNILLRTEEEIGEDDLKTLEVPDELQDKFEKFDKDEMLDE